MHGTSNATTKEKSTDTHARSHSACQPRELSRLAGQTSTGAKPKHRTSSYCEFEPRSNERQHRWKLTRNAPGKIARLVTSPSIPRRIRRTPDVAAHSSQASPLPKGWHEQSAESTRALTTRVKKRGNTCGAKCGHRRASSHTDETGPQDTTDDTRPTTVRVRYVVTSDLLFRSGPNFVSSLLVLHSRSALQSCIGLPSAVQFPSLMVLWSLQLGFDKSKSVTAVSTNFSRNHDHRSSLGNLWVDLSRMCSGTRSLAFSPRRDSVACLLPIRTNCTHADLAPRSVPTVTSCSLSARWFLQAVSRLSCRAGQGPSRALRSPGCAFSRVPLPLGSWLVPALCC